jgi:hypothetical protein
MKLSIVVPSNRATLSAYSKLLNYCSMASDDVEVIIRDNSGSAEKQDFFQRVQHLYHPNCKIITVPPCAAWENGRKVIETAHGDFFFGGCDDDLINGFALPSICEAIDSHKDDPTVIGITGKFLVERSSQSAIIVFPDTDKSLASERANAYLRSCLPSVLQFSATARKPYFDLLEYIKSLPIQASYFDQIYNVLLLMMGRLIPVPNVIYQYDMVNWSDANNSLREDAKYYTYSGIDTSAVRVHWLIGAFEGAKSIAGKFGGISHVPQAERQAVANLWFASRFQSFCHTPPRFLPDSKFNAEAETLAQKWQTAKSANINELLDDLTTFFALSSPEIGQRYYDFWK